MSRHSAAPDGAAAAAGLEGLADLLRAVPDHPSPGITFWDITPLLGQAGALRRAVDGLAELAGALGPVDLVAGVEARGFVVGTPLALALGAGFVPLRKAGKLPWRTVRQEYALEYGEAVIEAHDDAVPAGARVLVVDDVLATGGTAAAACSLVRRLGGTVTGAAFLLEVPGLPGREVVRSSGAGGGEAADVPVVALLAPPSGGGAPRAERSES